MHRFLLLALTAGLCIPAQAGVDPEIHKRCSDVKDYAGCVKIQSGKSPSLERKGNTCAEGYAYVGDGLCKQVVCELAVMHGLGNKDDPLIAGKSSWKCPYKFVVGFFNSGRGQLRLGAVTPIGNDSLCPAGEPKIGWNSTCEAPYIVSNKKKLPMACRNGVWDKDHPKCQLPEIKIPSPMDMD